MPYLFNWCLSCFEFVLGEVLALSIYVLVYVCAMASGSVEVYLNLLVSYRFIERDI